jgi:hypothetical protein
MSNHVSACVPPVRRGAATWLGICNCVHPGSINGTFHGPAS